MLFHKFQKRWMFNLLILQWLLDGSICLLKLTHDLTSKEKGPQLKIPYMPHKPSQHIKMPY